jgi:ATP-dependent helicase/nuclease subunit A
MFEKLQDNLIFFNAGAGTGKTFNIVERVVEELTREDKPILPEQVFITTFTRKAGDELKERIREKLFEKGFFDIASQMESALVGNLDSLCLELLNQYYFTAGLAPSVQLAENEQMLLNEALASLNIDNDKYELIEKFTAIDDWKLDLKNLIDKIRKYQMDLNGKQRSIDLTIKFYSNLLKLGTKSINYVDLKNKIESIITEYSKEGKISGEALKRKSFMQAILKNIRNKKFEWTVFSDFVKYDKIPKKEIELQEIQEICNNFKKTPEFKDSIVNYIQFTFDAAFQAISRYDEVKKQKGLVDFTDMQVKFLELLKNESVLKKELAENLKMIVVDEFQDSNPLQLSIYLKLIQVIPEVKVILVGDPKQAIYSFMGSDQQLFLNVYNKVLPIQKKELTKSYRSRYQLVDAANTLFKNNLDNYIELTSERDKNSGKTSDKMSDCWLNFHINPPKGTDTEQLLAKRIKLLLNDPPLVYDKQSKLFRAAVAEDIAILTRSNLAAAKMAGYFKKLDIPVRTKTGNIINKFEFKLFIALLEVILNPSAEKAKAELSLLLGKFNDVDELVKNKLNFLKEKSETTGPWLLDNTLKKVKNISFKVKNMPVPEAVRELVFHSGMFDALQQYESPNTSLSLLNEIVKLSDRYYSSLQLLNYPATLAGFFNWLLNYSQDIEKEEGEITGEGIFISTYHQSKGLEWPIVVMTDMDKYYQFNYDTFVQIPQDDFNVDHPLSNAAICYCFGWTLGGDNENQVVKNIFERNKTLKEDESKRLFYTGFTRARDYIITLTDNDGSLWLDNSLKLSKEQSFAKNAATIGDGSFEVKNNISLRNEFITDVILPFDDSAETRVFDAKEINHSYIQLVINPSSEKAPNGVEMQLKFVPDFEGTPLQHSLKGNTEYSDLGDCLHNILEMDVDPDSNITCEIIKAYGFEGLINPDSVIEARKRFYNYLGKTGRGFKESYCEYPFQAITEEGKLIKGTFDFIKVLNDEIFIIDHKSFRAENDEAIKKKLQKDYTGQMYYYKKACEILYPGKKIRLFFHLPVSGKMVEVI